MLDYEGMKNFGLAICCARFEGTSKDYKLYSKSSDDDELPYMAFSLPRVFLGVSCSFG